MSMIMTTKTASSMPSIGYLLNQPRLSTYIVSIEQVVCRLPRQDDMGKSQARTASSVNHLSIVSQVPGTSLGTGQREKVKKKAKMNKKK